jgi:hypothetical protein
MEMYHRLPEEIWGHIMQYLYFHEMDAFAMLVGQPSFMEKYFGVSRSQTYIHNHSLEQSHFQIVLLQKTRHSTLTAILRNLQTNSLHHEYLPSFIHFCHSFTPVVHTPQQCLVQPAVAPQHADANRVLRTLDAPRPLRITVLHSNRVAEVAYG